MTETDVPKKRRLVTGYGIVALVLFFILVISSSLPGPGQFNAAFRAQAADEATQIAMGCQGYKTEYFSWPEASENDRLVKILCGDNPRKIEFIYLKPRQLGPNGEDIDPWGTPYRIFFDSESKVQVTSAGPDKIFGTADDISNQ